MKSAHKKNDEGIRKPGAGFSAAAGVILAALLLAAAGTAGAQRRMEELGRGMVALSVPGGVFLSWRIPGTEWIGATYHVYRDGVKITTEPLTVSNFTDGAGTTTSSYSVAAVHDGTEGAPCAPVIPWQQPFREILLKPRDTAVYQINDATAADLDGDGEYEIIVKRIAPGWNEDNLRYSFFEAYRQDGTFLWEINVGPNILPDVEINLAAFDLDEDGKAEVFMRTSEGTCFGDGREIGDTDGDGRTNYRYSVGTAANMQYMNAGPEFLSLIDGLTGAELDRTAFIPRGQSSDWGDNYGHRASKYFFGAPYLDGTKPSLFTGRGIYTKTIMRTYDVVNKKLVLRWEFRSGDSGPYFGQGNHNYTIADVDGDGRDEIVWGSMTVDDDGTGLYSTQLGHGDAMHVGDLDPFRKGLEAFRCLENSPVYGTVLHDAATGEILIHHVIDRDCGRCCAANLSDDILGKALWGGSKMFSASTREVAGTSGGAENFRIYWDGDLLEELLDHSGFSTSTGYGTGAVYKYGQPQPLLLAEGAISCNYTKGTPSLQADLFGDWREEIIWRNSANTAIRIYTTVDPTPYRIYTLMHDPQYRQAICWQMCGYNQPPHVSYFLGEAEGKIEPPPPPLTNGRLVCQGSGSWDHASPVWSLDGKPAAFSDGDPVLFDITSGNDAAVSLAADAAPSVLSVNSPGSHTLRAAGHKLTGPMQLLKNGAGTFTLTGTHDYSGVTRIWDGSLSLSGELSRSPVELEFFGNLNASGRLGNGLTLRYGAGLEIGRPDSAGILQVAGHLTLHDKAVVTFDLFPSPPAASDSLIIEGNLSLSGNPLFRIKPHLPAGPDRLPAGDYLLASFTGTLEGNVSMIGLQGITGTPALLKTDGHQLILEVQSVRSAASVAWNGDKPGARWDVALTENFLAGETPALFVPGDTVAFTDAAFSKTVNIEGEVTPAAIQVDAGTPYLFRGTGKITGSTGLLKKGAGMLALENANSFTGKVLVTEGTLRIDKMPTSQADGGIGPASADDSRFELDGGTLLITSENNADRAIRLGPRGGTISNTARLILHEPVTGGTLTKTGSGNLVLAGANTHTRTLLKEGTLTLQNDDTNPGKNILLEGGTLQCHDNSGSYSTLAWNIEVPASGKAALRLDSRGYYTGSLTGGGILQLYIPFVRSDLNGDMSNFNGTLEAFSTYENSSGYPAELRINHSKGLPNALVVVHSSVRAYNSAGSNLILGALSGNGEVGGSASTQIQVGAKGTSSDFKGRITAGNLTKVGAGELILSGASSYTGTTTVRAGTLQVNNTTGSATGAGNVTVMNGATLTGTGSLAGNLTVESGGILKPGSSSTGYKTTVNGNVLLKAGSLMQVKVNPLFSLADCLAAQGNVTFAGNLAVNNTTPSPFKEGDSFKIAGGNGITGAFASVSPAVPGEGLAWDFSELQSGGLLKVAKTTASHLPGRKEFTLSPNPVDIRLMLELPAADGRVLVSVYTLSGVLLLQENHPDGGRMEIDVSRLRPGMYLVAVENGIWRELRKMTKK